MKKKTQKSKDKTSYDPDSAHHFNCFKWLDQKLCFSAFRRVPVIAAAAWFLSMLEKKNPVCTNTGVMV
jgi:hypothetical protein